MQIAVDQTQIPKFARGAQKTQEIITDMSGLFKGLANINEYISSWNTAGVTNMEGMFKARPPLPACR